MAWFIASIPFWLLGLFFLASGVINIFVRSPGETVKEQVEKFLACCFVGAILWVLAAIIC